MDFNKNILEWTKYDNEQKDYLNKIKEIREKKNKLSDNIISYIQINKLEDNLFKLPKLNTTIQLSKNKNYEGLTYKYLEECFNEYYENDQDKITEIIDFIRNKRKINEKLILITK